MRHPIAALLAVFALASCDSVPREPVSKCVPQDGDCASFVGDSVRVEPDVKLGRATFEKACVTCHGPQGGGKGDPSRGDFGDPAWQRKWSDSELMGIVTAGRGTKMPGFRFSRRELESVVMYVRTFAAAAPAPERTKSY